MLASYAEPCALTIIEARHAGCAIVGTSVGGTAEQLEFGRFGRLVGPGDPASLARELGALMRDPDALGKAKHGARQNLGHFNVHRVLRDYVRVYASALGATPL